MSELSKRMADAFIRLGIEDEEEDESMTYDREKEKEDVLISIEDNYKHYNSGYYWDDENHSGRLLVSQQIVDKYKLDSRVEPVNELFDQYDWSDEDRDEYSNFSYYIFISHSIGWTKTLEEGYSKSDCETPYGETGSEGFVMWWNRLPIELLNEDKDDIYVFSWCDG